MHPIRNSAKAIILRDGKLLCTKNLSQLNEIYYLLPGGGQEHGETLVTTLQRECLEEAGLRVAVKNLRYVRDYIADNHEFKQLYPGFHQVEYMFECEILEERPLAPGHSPDKYQIGLEWIQLESLGEFRVFPKILKQLITREGQLQGPCYLGDVN